jgi:hypothetical protein
MTGEGLYKAFSHMTEIIKENRGIASWMNSHQRKSSGLGKSYFTINKNKKKQNEYDEWGIRYEVMGLGQLWQIFADIGQEKKKKEFVLTNESITVQDF